MRKTSGTRLSIRSATRPHSTEGDPWARFAGVLRASANPWSSAAFGQLYLLAIAEGTRVLGTFRQMDSERKIDLALATLIQKLPQIAAATKPCAYFDKALFRDASSWLRGPRARIEDSEFPGSDGRPTGAEASNAAFRIDARRALGALRERERIVLVLNATGHTREEIACQLRTSRANVDQIISRARRSVS